MNASRAALMVVGVNLVAVWAAAAAGGRAAATVPAVPPQVEAVVEARASLVASTERLEAHARRDVAPAMVRDPFRFGAEARPAGRRPPARPELESPAAGAEAMAAPVETEPDVVLQGMAESDDGEGIVRTAILRAGHELILASLGMRVGDRYEVVALAADSIELEDTANHVRHTLRMK